MTPHSLTACMVLGRKWPNIWTRDTLGMAKYVGVHPLQGVLALDPHLYLNVGTS